MYGQISTLAFIGIEARPVEVQVRVTPGAAAFAIVGLPDKAVAESRERVRNALHAVGLGLPFKHITVNLAPADLPKEGSHFDLPIVLAMMSAMEAIAPDAIANYAAIGELALDGSIRAVPGTLPAAIGANALGKGLICPAATGPEAAWASEEIDILAAPHLLSLVNHFKGMQTLSRPKPNVLPVQNYAADLRDIKGQETAKRALEIAAAGNHNLLMIFAIDLTAAVWSPASRSRKAVRNGPKTNTRKREGAARTSAKTESLFVSQVLNARASDGRQLSAANRGRKTICIRARA